MSEDINSEASEEGVSRDSEQQDELLDETWLAAVRGSGEKGLRQNHRGATAICKVRAAQGPTAIYVRYSPRPQEAETSVERQTQACRRYLDSIGAPQPDPSRIFIDRMVSGASANRPAYQDMIQDLEAGGHTLAVSEFCDRITRDMVELSRIHGLYEYHGAEIHFADRGQLRPSMIGVHGFLSMEQRRQIRMRTMRGRRQAAEEGRWVCGAAPYGFRKVPGGGGFLEICQEEAMVVQRAARDFAEGASIHSIVVALNLEGIASPKGGRWSSDGLLGKHGLLRRRLNVGDMIFGMSSSEIDPVTGRSVVRVVPEEDWTVVKRPELAILDRDLFQAVQDRIAREYSCGRGPIERRDRLLIGIVYCQCGSRMDRNGGGALVCSSYVSAGICNDGGGGTRMIEYVDRDVLRMLRDDLMERDGRSAEMAFDRACVDAGREVSGDRRELLRRSCLLDQQLEQSFVGNETVGFSKERVAEMRCRLEDELLEIKRSLEVLEHREITPTLASDDLARLRAAFTLMIERAPFEAFDEADRTLLKAFRGMVESVVIHVPRNSRSYRILITLRHRHRNSDGSRRTIERSFNRYRDGFHDDPGRAEASQSAAESGLFGLADDDWAAIEHLFVDHRFYRLEPRRLVDALLFHAWTGVPVYCTPKWFGDTTTLRTAASRTVRSGIWESLVAILAGAGSPVVDGLDAAVFDRWKRPKTA